MQLPTGLLVDSLGPKKLLTFGAMAAALGTFIFAVANSFFLACLGRAIVGGSVAVAWVVMLKLATHWFPSRRYAMVSGVALCFGVLGALSAGVPLRLLIDHFGWRTVMEVSAGITLLIAIVAKIVVNDNPSTRGFAELCSLCSGPTWSGETFASFQRVARGICSTGIRGCCSLPQEDWWARSWHLQDCGEFPL